MKHHAMSGPLTGPRRPDAHHMGKVLPSTQRRYRDSLRPFVAYLIDNNFAPEHPHEWDDLLMEYKNEHQPRRAAFEALVAGLEFAMPHVKGGLGWSRTTLTGWAISAPVKHTVPLLRAPCRLLACYIAADGRPRVGAGMVLQRELGLRPGEVVGLYPEDVVLPETLAAGSGFVRAIVSLGTRKSTKAKRVQSVVVRNPLIIGLLRWMVHVCVRDSSLMGCSYDTYRKLLLSAQKKSGLDSGYTPHSPRAGFATESIAEGIDFVSVREAGRWLSDTSLRVYLDLVGAAALAAVHRAAGREHELVYAASNFLKFFPDSESFQRESDHHGAVAGDAYSSAARSRGLAVPSLGSSARAHATGLPATETIEGEHTSSEDEPGVTFADTGASVGVPGRLTSHGERIPRGRGRGQEGSRRGAGRGRQPSQGSR